MNNVIYRSSPHLSAAILKFVLISLILFRPAQRINHLVSKYEFTFGFFKFLSDKSFNKSSNKSLNFINYINKRLVN